MPSPGVRRADRLREGGIVEAQRDVIPGALAGLVPAGADFGSVLGLAEMNAPVGCIVAVLRLGWDDAERRVELDRLDAALEAFGRAGEGADLHGIVLSVGG